MMDKASATVSVGLNVNNPDVMILFVVKSKRPLGSGEFPEMIHWRVIYIKHEAKEHPIETHLTEYAKSKGSALRDIQH